MFDIWLSDAACRFTLMTLNFSCISTYLYINHQYIQMPSFQYVKIYILLYCPSFCVMITCSHFTDHFWVNAVFFTLLLQSKIKEMWIAYFHTKLKAMDFPQLQTRAHFHPRCSITNALCTEHCFLNMLERKEAGKWKMCNL